MSRSKFQKLDIFPADDPPRDLLIKMPESMVRALETVAKASRQSRNAIVRHAVTELMVRLHLACKSDSAIQATGIHHSIQTH